MPHTRTFLLSLAFTLLAGNAWSACDRNEYGVFEEIGCASEALTEAEKELDAVYRKAFQSFDRSQKDALSKSQSTWRAFLRSQAEFVYAAEGNGSSGRLIVTNEMEELTRARAKALRGWAHQ